MAKTILSSFTYTNYVKGGCRLLIYFSKIYHKCLILFKSGYCDNHDRCFTSCKYSLWHSVIILLNFRLKKISSHRLNLVTQNFSITLNIKFFVQRNYKTSGFLRYRIASKLFPRGQSGMTGDRVTEKLLEKYHYFFSLRISYWSFYTTLKVFLHFVRKQWFSDCNSLMKSSFFVISLRAVFVDTRLFFLKICKTHNYKIADIIIHKWLNNITN